MFIVDGPTSADLLKVGLNIIPAEQCGQMLSAVSSNRFHNVDDASQLCAGNVKGGEDTCAVRRDPSLFYTARDDVCAFRRRESIDLHCRRAIPADRFKSIIRSTRVCTRKSEQRRTDTGVP